MEYMCILLNKTVAVAASNIPVKKAHNSLHGQWTRRNATAQFFTNKQ